MEIAYFPVKLRSNHEMSGEKPWCKLLNRIDRKNAPAASAARKRIVVNSWFRLGGKGGILFHKLVGGDDQTDFDFWFCSRNERRCQPLRWPFFLLFKNFDSMQRN